ncbi:uncharacterized protein LOC131675378 [Phymastichus coffea]|uniref:uncharacterized protein LOC131675378 n=1 Tax=Phymastichus coffea TaxID=108790 RepID=UPI00273BF805|nr:uncharacterized protein LOC131675378 [Phymastichus coffea]
MYFFTVAESLSSGFCINLSTHCLILETKQSIKAGEELTCFYEKEYFGDNNERCQCQSCKKNLQGAFRIDKKISDSQIKQTFTEAEIFSLQLNKYKDKVDKYISQQINYDELKNQRKANGQIKKGLKYDTNLYRKLVYYISTKKLIKSDILVLEDEQILEIASHVYKNKHCSTYKALKHFIKKYNNTIIKDVQGTIKNQNIVIFAPGDITLQNYHSQIAYASINLYPIELAECLYEEKMMPLIQRRNILAKVLQIDPTMILKADYQKIYNEFRMYKIHLQRVCQTLLNAEFTIDSNQLSSLKEVNILLIRLTEDEINAWKSKSISTSLEIEISNEITSTTITQNCESSCELLPFSSIHKAQVDIFEPKKSVKTSYQKQTKMPNPWTTKKYQLFQNQVEVEINKALLVGLKYDDDNEQIIMLRKLIIFYFTTDRNYDLNVYMSCSSMQTSKKVKENIVKTMYGEVKTYLISLLDINKPYRYIIKKKVISLKNFFGSHYESFVYSALEHCRFEDIENRFYKVTNQLIEKQRKSGETQ